MKIVGKIFRSIFYGLFLLLFVWISGQLFFEEETNNVLEFGREFLFGYEEKNDVGITEFRIIYPEEPSSLEPTLLDPTTRQRLVNIYESLVRLDMDLKGRPALALSWGLIDDVTWEFNLRPGVKFHDGSGFDVNDVVASFERASSYSKSELTDVLSSIKNIEIIDGMTFRVITYDPDPLLLQKLSALLIIPSEYANEDSFDPVGTASYMFDSWNPGEKMIFKKFSSYWGYEAKFEKVEMFSYSDKSKRVNSFLNGEADFLAFVPYDAVDVIESRGFEIASIPTLEVQFLLFNVNSGFLENPLSREAVSLAIDRNALAEKVGFYVNSVNQFVSNGVFGFNPDISNPEYDPEKAEDFAEDSDLLGKTLKLHLPIGLEVLGEHVRKSLREIGVYVAVSYLEVDDLLESMKNKSADMYFLGFKSEMGDSVSFLDSVVYSGGDSNIFDYKNINVDYLIELALVEFDVHNRREHLQEAMQIIVEQDIVGIPLFEYETLFSFYDVVSFTPRIDGLIYFDELIVN